MPRDFRFHCEFLGTPGVCAEPIAERSDCDARAASPARSVRVARSAPRANRLRRARGPFTLLAAWIAAFGAVGCEADLGCAASATCAPSGDASTESNVDADGARDGSRDGDASADASADRPDNADRTDGMETIDAFSDGDAASLLDASADRATDVTTIDVTSDVPFVDATTDVPLCNVDAGQSPIDNPCMISERYGVFVSPAGSDSTGAGTRGAPFRTMMRALQAAKAETRRVFACDNGTGYADAMSIDASLDGMALYGGFDCTRWTIAANARTVLRPAAGPALTLTNLSVGAIVDHFDLQSADAALNESSIAVVVQSSQHVVFRRTRIASAKGGNGSNGADGVPGDDATPVGLDQQGLPATCGVSTTAQPETPAQTSACGSKAGSGGGCDSALVTGFPGTSGLPMKNVDPPDHENAGTICIADCYGRRGSDGNPGGSGATNTKAGSVTATGFTPALPGGSGASGYPAQGGGGGAGTVSDHAANGCVGATGGSGGLGGCGGGGGGGGSSGGASMALLSWQSDIVLDSCEVVSGDGGSGGSGGKGNGGGRGATGAQGGAGFNDGNVAIYGGGYGGAGGTGGPGGSGAGGNGGPSYAIAHAGARPLQSGGTTVARGNGGAKGRGGALLVVTLPDGGFYDAGPVDAGADVDAGPAPTAPDGLPGDAAYEFAVP